MAFASEPHLDKVGGDGQLVQGTARGGTEHGLALEGCVRSLAPLGEIAIQNALSHVGNGKSLQRTAHVSARVSQLKPASQDDVEGGSRHDSQLPTACHGIGQTPIRDAGAHAPLDDLWQWIHPNMVVMSTG